MIDHLPAFMSGIQAAIQRLVTVYEPTFLAFGYDLFMAFALLRVLLHAIQQMTGRIEPSETFPAFIELMLELAFGYCLVIYYEVPFPGTNISFSNLITGTMEWLARLLDAGALERVAEHLLNVYHRFDQPGWDLMGVVMYGVLMIVVVVSVIAVMMPIAGAIIATAVCGLVGPIFVPFLIAPQLRWLFDGWLRTFITNAFVPVIAIAYLMVFEQFLYAFRSTLPPDIPVVAYPLYLINVGIVFGAFIYGMFSVRSLASSIISGHAHSGGGGGLLRSLLRKF